MKQAILLLRDRSFFGANIVNLPAIYLTKKYLQADKITLFTDINVKYFYDQIPWVTHQSDARHFFTIYKKIPKHSNFLYSMRPSMDSASLLKPLKQIKTAIGFSLRSGLLNRLFDQHYRYDTSVYRAVSHIQPLLNYLALPNEASYYLREAMLALVDPTTPRTESRICIMPGAGGGEHKKWGIENYWQLITKLHQYNSALHFDFMMGSDEEQELAFLLAQKRTIPFTIQQNLGLQELIGHIENSALTIANDCGPSHISQCLVKPFIGLYYEPNAEWFLPHPLSRNLSPASTDNDIKRISIEQVLATSIELLALGQTTST